ncbi:hypothetical protein [Streptomyces winkii]|uniref:hypothetical protein n=1 Tax=Streptomyces winkii TaxID=3051178 RepID=UPI0028D30103|nr:hypothetical protein [Streptomyces sp. DSM 40971]
MTDKNVEQTGEQHPQAPWWAGLGTGGAVTLIVLGAVAAAWTFLAPAAGLSWLPFTPEEPATGYYQAAKVVAIGLVILGTTLLGRRGRTAAAEEGGSQGRPQRD